MNEQQVVVVDQYQQLAARTRAPQEEVLKRIAELEWSSTVPGCRTLPTNAGAMIQHAIVGIVGETGELASAWEKFAYYGQPFDRANIIEELGDLLWYVAELCDAIDVNMSLVMINNIKKLQVRYPEKYSDILAAEENRDRVEERKAVENTGKEHH